MQAWATGHRCIIPAECIYEPSYETGKCVWCRIGQPGAVTMGIAGIYRDWPAPDGRRLWTMAMLTVNAADHPVMKRFHKPGEEKRMVIVLDPTDYRDWLTCSVAEAPRFFRQWMGSLETFPRDMLTPPPRRPPAAAQGDLL